MCYLCVRVCVQLHNGHVHLHTHAIIMHTTHMHTQTHSCFVHLSVGTAVTTLLLLRVHTGAPVHACAHMFNEYENHRMFIKELSSDNRAPSYYILSHKLL